MIGVGVMFYPNSRIYYYLSDITTLKPKDKVYVDTVNGLKIADVVLVTAKPNRFATKRVFNRINATETSTKRQYDFNHYLTTYEKEYSHA